MLDSTTKYATRFQPPKSLSSLMTQKDKLLIKLKMKLPKLLLRHHMAESQMTGSSFLQHTRLISLSRLMWDLWGGHFLFFSASVAAVVFIMMLPFYIFTQKSKCFWWWIETDFILNHSVSEMSQAQETTAAKLSTCLQVTKCYNRLPILSFCHDRGGGEVLKWYHHRVLYTGMKPQCLDM